MMRHDSSTYDSASESSEAGPTERQSSVNAFREVKTSQYDRPLQDKKILEKREKIATRHSRRLKDIITTKEKLLKVVVMYIIYLFLHT